ncbi:uncharacterized protein [Clytia hemisphaerica]|uniref:uncharacterized protein n=1 Tax=Clytia hemisphaerica TaxID=252671 RepID=UPI0034D79DDE
MINPIYPGLPKISIFTMVTCNCFDNQMVREQYNYNKEMYEKHIENVLGPVIGISSDGDSRRRKLFIELSTVSTGSRYLPIPREYGFIFSARLEGDKISDLCDQDYIHNHKKLINHLDHKARTLQAGKYLIHLNQIREVYEKFPIEIHGLRKTDINRDDRQNWRSAQRLSFKKVQELLKEIKTEANKATLVYLKVVWYYVEIFCSDICSLVDRIKYCATVCFFLGIWRNWVRRNKSTTLDTSFISRQSYIDTITSCHFATTFVIYCRDFFDNMECHLEESGTDCCENYFSCLGQWTGNKHNYTYADMTRNRDHCTRLEQIRCNPDGPKFAKPHPKSESIWKQQYESGYTKCNLKSYPAVGEELKAWKKGIVEARKLAISVGMSPASSNRIDSVLPFTKENDDTWFFNPFHFKGNTFQDLSSFPTDGADPLDVDFEMLSKDADSDGTNETEDVSNQEYLPNSELSVM